MKKERSDYLTQTKVSRTLQIVLYLDSEVPLVYRLFALLLTHLRTGVRVPIPYVQDAILNLHHPYIVVATMTTDTLAYKNIVEMMEVIYRYVSMRSYFIFVLCWEQQ